MLCFEMVLNYLIADGNQSPLMLHCPVRILHYLHISLSTEMVVRDYYVFVGKITLWG